MGNLFGGIVLITFGILFLLDNLGYADFSEVIHNYWPLILVVWGLSILKKRRPSAQKTTNDITQQSPSDLIHQSNVFGDIFTKITSSNFKGGSISTVFGDCDIDLAAAAFAEGEHELRIHSVFGDSRITLPNNGAVSVSASATFGDLNIQGQHKSGFSNDIQSVSSSYSATPNRLKIHISKVFGDVRVE